MENTKYVHGYTGREALRLNDQAETLEEIIHNDTIFSKNSLVLEAGCGIGAQTRIIAAKNPETSFLSIDISKESLNEARETTKKLGITNVKFEQANIFDLPFEEETFDSIILCFVLEHLPNPEQALEKLKRVLKKGGNIILIEGDHGSAFFYPDSQYAQMAIDSLIKLQKQNGGNANIGRALFPLLQSIGFVNINVTPRTIYVDANKPKLIEGFTKNTFTAMVEGIGNDVVNKGIIDAKTFNKGIEDLYRTAEPDGVFNYTFFKAFAVK